MKKTNRFLILIAFIGALSVVALAAPDSIDLTIDSTANISGNGAIEACGTAKPKSGSAIQPILITLQHAESTYTTIVGPAGRWCILYKRWTYDGQISVGAQFLGQSFSGTKHVTSGLQAE